DFWGQDTSSGESSPDIIWAYGDTNPGSSAKDAKIKIHVDKGTAKLKFAATSGTTGGTTGGTTSSGNSHPAGGGGPGQAGSPSTNTTSPGGTTASKGTSSGSTASSGNSTSSGTNNSSTLSPSSCGMLMVSALIKGPGECWVDTKGVYEIVRIAHPCLVKLRVIEIAYVLP
ncbi:hypothetical protein MPER_03559, partial [Moniliophthora perniciosa FA553]